MANGEIGKGIAIAANRMKKRATNIYICNIYVTHYTTKHLHKKYKKIYNK